jgi:hypothetical protein
MNRRGSEAHQGGTWTGREGRGAERERKRERDKERESERERESV